MQSPDILLQITTESLFARSSKSIILFVLFFLISLPSRSQDKRILLIGIDGLLAEAVGLPEASNINSLYKKGNGILTFGYTEDLTFSGPSWSSILHGVHHDRHGVDTNEYHGHDFSEYPNLLRRLKNHNPELYTAAFFTWSLLQNNFSGSSEGVDALVYHPREENGDQKVTEELVELIKTGDPGAVFYYQNDIDKAGHNYGFSMEVPEYREQVRITDSHIGRVLDSLKKRPEVAEGNEEWLIVLVTDHGGVGTAHSGNLYGQRFIPLIISRIGSPSQTLKGQQSSLIRPRNVDITKTILTWMEVPETEYVKLDGHDLLAPDRYELSEAGYNTNLIFNGDGEFDRGFPSRKFDQAISGWRDQEQTGRWDGYHSMTVVTAPLDLHYLNAETAKGADQNSNLFTGGNKGTSSKITQRISLKPLQSDIDDRMVSFEFSAYLSDIGNNGDRMEATIYFQNKERDVIGSSILKAVSQEEQVDHTILRYYQAKGHVPPGTDSLLFELHAIGTSGSGIKAYADKLAFILKKNTTALEAKP